MKTTSMEATLEISMYPLQSDYKEHIRSFIRGIQEHAGIKVRVNGISTQIFGDYDDIISILQSPVKRELEKEMGVVFVMKLTSGHHDADPKI